MRLGKCGWRLDVGAHGAPVEIEIVDGNGALRIADPDQGDVAGAGGERQKEVQLLHLGPPHVHFEFEEEIGAL